MATSTVGILRVLLTANTAEFDTAMKKAASSAQAWSKDLKNIGTQASQIGTALTKTLTLPIAGIALASAKAAMDFESSFAGVRKTVDATDAEFAQMAQQFRNLAKEIPINVNELNRLGEAAGALGIPKAEIVDFSRVMALLGQTTNVTSDQAASSIAKIQNIFGAAGQDTERFASTLVDLGNKGASTEQEILALATRVASAGHAIGLSEGQVLGFSSAIANVGIEAEAGGSAMSKVFNDIAIAVSKGGSEVEQFAAVAGMSVEQFSKLFKDDAASAVLAFVEGLNRVQSSGGNLFATLEQLGFKEIRQSNLLRSLALSGDNLRNSLDTQATAWEKNSALSEEARKRFETTEKQLDLLWARVRDVGITLGNALLPGIQSAIGVFNKLIPIVDGVAKSFAALPGSMQLVIVGLGLAVAAAGPMLYIFGQLVISAGAVVGAFTTKGIATRALTVAMGENTVAATANAGATAATGAAATVATPAVTGLGVAMTILGRAVAVVGVAWASWQAGRWIGETTGLTDGIGRLTAKFGEFIGMLPEGTAKQYDQMRAAQQAAEASKAQGDASKVVAEIEKGVADALKLTTAATTTQATATQSLTAEMAAARAEIAEKVTPAIRNELVQALASGALEISHLKDRVSLSDMALGMLKQQLDAGVDALKKHNTELQVAAAQWNAHVTAINNAKAGVYGIIPAFQLTQGQLLLTTNSVTSQIKSFADLNGTVGLMPAVLGMTRAEMDALTKVPVPQWLQDVSTTIGTLGSAIQGTFSQMLLHAKGFHDGFVDIWNSIKSAVGNIFTQILNDFTGRFLKGIIGALTGAQGGFAGAFGGLLGGGGSGGGGLLGGLLGGGLGGLFGGAGAGAVTGVATGGAGLLSSTALSGFAGLPGGAGAAGATGLFGLSGAATAGIGAAVAGAVLLGMKLFGASEESKSVNKPRDAFLQSFEAGGANAIAGLGGGTSLAAALTGAGAGAGGGALMKAIFDADTVAKYNKAVADATAFLDAYKLKQQETAAAADEAGAAATEAGADEAAASAEATAALDAQAEAAARTAAAVAELENQRKSLMDSIANEAPEEEMGVVEQATRDQIAAIDEQIAKTKAAGDTTVATNDDIQSSIQICKTESENFGFTTGEVATKGQIDLEALKNRGILPAATGFELAADRATGLGDAILAMIARVMPGLQGLYGMTALIANGASPTGFLGIRQRAIEAGYSIEGMGEDGIKKMLGLYNATAQVASAVNMLNDDSPGDKARLGRLASGAVGSSSSFASAGRGSLDGLTINVNIGDGVNPLDHPSLEAAIRGGVRAAAKELRSYIFGDGHEFGAWQTGLAR